VQLLADDPGDHAGDDEREGERPRLRLIEIIVSSHRLRDPLHRE
jgi:hypothetical protein